MNKLELAHEWAMRIGPETNLPLDILVDSCFNYAEAMLAENSRREDKSRPEVLRAVQQHFIDGVEQPKYAPDNFEVDWNQAPLNATHWTMKEDGVCLWWRGKPLFDGSCFYDAIGICHTVGFAPSFNYTGDWKESLRKRPE